MERINKLFRESENEEAKHSKVDVETKKKAAIDNPKKRVKVHRTKDAERVRGMVNYADQFDAKVVAMETDDVEYSTRYKQSLADIDSTSNNASAGERESKIKSFEIASKKERTYIAVETRFLGICDCSSGCSGHVSFPYQECRRS